MGFFDLNIPYLERDGSAAAAASQETAGANKAGRLRMVVKAMELGYTGVAYNRTVRGVISDADRCKIPPLPLSSLLKAAPALTAAARFHRELLGVPLSSPFRQYTRLTVAVDSALGAAALHPGNAVLRTYHLVAVRPLNQAAFDQACKVSEVDLIAIDFSHKLPFRLKLSMVKAAIERGVYFEVTYSHLISDIHLRRQMLSNGKLLVDWTRGKNLILSSGTSNVNEVRGPYDVINLSSLLGLSMERAKVAISRNCRSLLNNALRRKQCYKEALRVEKISPSQCLDAKEPWFVDWGNWDPISSGEGDLPALDDIARFLSASGQAPKSYDVVSFDAVSDVVLFDKISNKEGDLVSLDDRGPPFPSTSECDPSTAANEASCEDKVEVLTEDEILLPVIPLEHQLSDNESDLAPSPGFVKQFSINEDSEPVVTENEAPNVGDMCDIACSADEQPWSGNLSNICNPDKEFELVSLDGSVKLCTVSENPVIFGVSVSEVRSSGEHDSISAVLDTPADVTSSRDLICDAENEVSPMDNERPTSSIDFLSGTKGKVSPKDNEWPLGNLMEIDPPLFSTKDVGSMGEQMGAHNMPEMQALAKMVNLEKEDPFMSVYNVLLQKDCAKCDTTGEDDRVTISDGGMFNEASDIKMLNQNGAVSVADDIPSKDILVNMEQDGEVSAAGIGSQQKKLKLGKVKFKRKLRHRVLPLLSRHFMHHVPSKKFVHSKSSRKKYCKNKT